MPSVEADRTEHAMLIMAELDHLQGELETYRDGSIGRDEFLARLALSVQVILRILEVGDPPSQDGPKQDPPKAKTTQADRKAPLYWTKASVLLSAKSDPYNAEYAKAVQQREINGRTIGGSGASGQAAAAGVSITATVLSTLSSTGYGAILVAAYAILTLIGKYAIPPSEGGWEKLTPLQRLRATLYQLLPEFESQRNQTIFASQKLDLSIPPGFVPDIHTPQYVMYIRNRLIRGAYAAHFYRITHTDDEATLPAPIVTILQKAKMWPPPLPPVKPEYFGPAGPGNANYLKQQWKFGGLADNISRASEVERLVVDAQYRIISSQYAEDIKKFNEVASLAILRGEIRDFAMQNGCIPDLADVDVSNS